VNNSHRQRAMSTGKVVIRRHTIGFNGSHSWAVYLPNDGQSYGFWDHNKAIRFASGYVKREKDKAAKK
jgi:hypothetical protein